jgi:hypothetical protein
MIFFLFRLAHSLSLSLISSRDRTSLSTLRQMLPEDLLRYCQTNRLVESVLGRDGTPVSTQRQHPHSCHADATAPAAARMHPGPPPTSRGRYY